MSEALTAAREALAGEDVWLVGGAVRDRLLSRETDDIELAIAGNPKQPARRIARAVHGAAFKPDSDDVRDSPALNIAATLQLAGAQVRVHDPEAIDNARALFPTLDYALDVEKACERADLVLHLTEWQQYRDLDPAVLAKVV